VFRDGCLRWFRQRTGISRTQEAGKLALCILPLAFERYSVPLATSGGVKPVFNSNAPTLLAAALNTASAHFVFLAG
jgi:hypothetical protein